MLERILFDQQLMQDKDWLMTITMLLMKLEKRYCYFFNYNAVTDGNRTKVSHNEINDIILLRYCFFYINDHIKNSQVQNKNKMMKKN
jgi:hypothetical protein